MCAEVWIISFSSIARDPRIMRQIWSLSDRHNLHVFGHGPRPADVDIGFTELSRPEYGGFFSKLTRNARLLSGRYDKVYWDSSHIKSLMEATKRTAPDAIIANDIEALPAAIKMGAGTVPVVFDAHEFSPEQHSGKLRWRLLTGRRNHYFCERYIPAVSRMMTVSNGIAQEYKDRYRTEATIVTNAPAYADQVPTPVSAHQIKMIHHGVASEARQTHLMIEVLKSLGPMFSLDFMLLAPEKAYYETLTRRASEMQNIRFLDPVPMPQIPAVLNDYDIGLYILPPYSLNAELALPNKVFEFIQGRLALAVSPSPEMARLVHGYGIGVVAEGYEPKDMAAALNNLTVEDIRRYKEASHRAAPELCFETNTERIRSLVADAIADKSSE